MINDKLKLINLFDRYKSCLSNKQQIYFEAYYLNDFSLSEIASKYYVSRNAVLDALKIAKTKLLKLEENLNYNNFFENLIIICQNAANKKEMIQKTKLLLKDLEEKE